MADVEAGGRVGYERIVETRLAGDVDALTDASLWSVYQQALALGAKSMAILGSAPRGDQSGHEVEAGYEGLLRAVQTAGLGFIRMRRRWREHRGGGIPRADCPERRAGDVGEPAVAVMGISKVLAHKLGRKYDQHPILFVELGSRDEATLILRDGGEETLGQFHPRRVVEAYSELGGGAPESVSFDYRPQSFIQTLIEQVVARRFDGAPR